MHTVENCVLSGWYRMLGSQLRQRRPSSQHVWLYLGDNASCSWLAGVLLMLQHHQCQLLMACWRSVDVATPSMPAAHGLLAFCWRSNTSNASCSWLAGVLLTLQHQQCQLLMACRRSVDVATPAMPAAHGLPVFCAGDKCRSTICTRCRGTAVGVQVLQHAGCGFHYDKPQTDQTDRRQQQMQWPACAAQLRSQHCRNWRGQPAPSQSIPTWRWCRCLRGTEAGRISDSVCTTKSRLEKTPVHATTVLVSLSTLRTRTQLPNLTDSEQCLHLTIRLGCQKLYRRIV